MASVSLQSHRKAGDVTACSCCTVLSAPRAWPNLAAPKALATMTRTGGKNKLENRAVPITTYPSRALYTSAREDQERAIVNIDPQTTLLREMEV